MEYGETTRKVSNIELEWTLNQLTALNYLEQSDKGFALTEAGMQRGLELRDRLSLDDMLVLMMFFRQCGALLDDGEE